VREKYEAAEKNELKNAGRDWGKGLAMGKQNLRSTCPAGAETVKKIPAVLWT